MGRDDLKAALGIGAIVLAAALPLLVAVPFGWLWLWENGYLLHWLAATLLISLGVFTGQRYLLRRLTRMRDGAARDGTPGDAQMSGPDAPRATLSASPREEAAWAVVEARAAAVDPDALTSREAILKLGVETVEAVAGAMHPQEKDPVWNFTVPEALALVEQVSARLRPVVADSIPLGDRLTVGQVIRLYRWRSLVDAGEKLYDLWRIVRLANPLAAATQEIRERMSKQAMQQLRADLARRLAALYVREVGRTAIDLYSGRLKVTPEALRGHVSRASLEDAARSEGGLAEPLRFLVIGQVGAGKSSLVNALAVSVSAAADALPATRDFSAVTVSREGTPEIALIDSPGLEAGMDLAALSDKALSADLVLLAVPAHRADRGVEREALARLQDAYAQRVDRRMPPVLVAATHADRLRPFGEWSPPYDLDDTGNAKAQSIRAACAAIAADLSVPADAVIPLSLAEGAQAWNVDALWAEIAVRLPEAESARLLRCLREAAPGMDWRRIGSQIAGAGRLAYDALRRSGGKSG